MELSEYQAKAVGTAIYPYKYRCLYPALGLAGEAGETCEKVKKLIRDDGFDPENKDKDQAWYDKRDEIKKELGDVLWYVAALARDFELNLDDIADFNIAKLASRQERGVLGGSGDNR